MGQLGTGAHWGSARLTMDELAVTNVGALHRPLKAENGNEVSDLLETANLIEDIQAPVRSVLLPTEGEWEAGRRFHHERAKPPSNWREPYGYHPQTWPVRGGTIPVVYAIVT
jgi:hypothetical protein